LAVAIGTVHGLYKSTPNLDLIRLKSIRKYVDVPLVLHGASGLNDDEIKLCIKAGICKVNFATDLRIAYSNGVKSVIQNEPEVFDPKVYGKVAREIVKDLVITLISICGCANRY
jgi:tagatose 1,6-diphosphate aldolase GatY/KbaY